MSIPPTARGAAAAVYAYALQSFACRPGEADGVSLVWEVDFVAHPEHQALMEAYMQRLKGVLHALPCGTTPIRIRQWLNIQGSRVGVDVLLPLPDVSGDLPRLCGRPPPIGVWKLEVVDREIKDRHGSSHDRPDFEHDIPF